MAKMGVGGEPRAHIVKAFLPFSKWQARVYERKIRFDWRFLHACFGSITDCPGAHLPAISKVRFTLLEALTRFFLQWVNSSFYSPNHTAIDHWKRLPLQNGNQPQKRTEIYGLSA